MKKGIEELLKESLQHQEAPYAPAAWEDMQKRLDKAMPVNTSKNNVFRNFGLGLAGLAVVGTSIWYFNQHDEVVVAETNQKELVKNNIETKLNTTKKTISEKNSTNSSSVQKGMCKIKSKMIK
jgi:hypothetical protein